MRLQRVLIGIAGNDLSIRLHAAPDQVNQVKPELCRPRSGEPAKARSRTKIALDNFNSRGRNKAEALAVDFHIFLLIVKAIFRNRFTHSFN
jgi:hypothetical protein